MAPHLNINGEEIPFVPLDDFTLDECKILYDWSGLTLDKATQVDGFHPGFTGGLLHVAYARAHPGAGEAMVRSLIGAIKVLELEQVFASITEEAPDPLAPIPMPSDEDGNPNGSESGPPSNDDGEPSPDSTPDDGSGDPSSEKSYTSIPAAWGG